MLTEQNGGMTFEEAKKCMEGGERVYASSWPITKSMRIMTPDEWDGPFALQTAIIVIEDETGTHLHCTCMEGAENEQYYLVSKR